MKASWRFLLFVDFLCLLFILLQIVLDKDLLFLVIVASAFLALGFSRKNHKGSRNFLLLVGGVILVGSLLSTVAFWILVAFTGVFLILKSTQFSGETWKGAPWRKKSMVMVQTTDASHKAGKKFKRPWFGNERLGNDVYEWDDINFSIIAGDTIVDLGNTLLPKEENVIIIRKGFGRTRILVPVGISISLEHSAMIGKLTFDGKTYPLKNEGVKLFSEDYDTQTRRLKIVTNTLLGDIEVLRV